MNNVTISWKNTKGKKVISSFPEDKVDAIVAYLETVVGEVTVKQEDDILE